MLAGGTIVAQASAPGRSARAIVRLSGDETLRALAHVLEQPVESPGAHRAAVVLGPRTLACLALVFAPGRSYTGELSAEIQLPGNPHLVRRVIGSLLEVGGVRMASPGEYTARAYLSGRMTAEQAEGVLAVIAARTEAELGAARRLLSGETGARYAALADELAACLALVEAGIDFVEEEDVVAIPLDELRRRLVGVRDEIAALTGGSTRESAVDGAVRVVLAGAVNAGKSTLFNALLGRARSVASATPGATRDAIEEPLDLGPREPTVTLVDLAGLDAGLAAGSALDASAQRRAIGCIEGADVIVHCDPGGRFEPLPAANDRATTLRVRTKGDLLAVEHDEDLSVCALDGFNLEALKRAIADASAGSVSAAGEALALMPRHRRALAEADSWVERALGHEEAELIAGALRGGLDALAEVSGEITPDDVLGRIFASFCVGK